MSYCKFGQEQHASIGSLLNISRKWRCISTGQIAPTLRPTIDEAPSPGISSRAMEVVDRDAARRVEERLATQGKRVTEVGLQSGSISAFCAAEQRRATLPPPSFFFFLFVIHLFSSCSCEQGHSGQAHIRRQSESCFKILSKAHGIPAGPSLVRTESSYSKVVDMDIS